MYFKFNTLALILMGYSTLLFSEVEYALVFRWQVGPAEWQSWTFENQPGSPNYVDEYPTYEFMRELLLNQGVIAEDQLQDVIGVIELDENQDHNLYIELNYDKQGEIPGIEVIDGSITAVTLFPQVTLAELINFYQ